MQSMRVSIFLALVCMALVSGGSGPFSQSPTVIYGTYLGGGDKECATAIAVDSSENAYVVGRTPSPDFPVTSGAFSTKTRVHNDDWTGFVSKISPRGDRLVYSSFLGGNYRSSANAVAVDSAGRSFVVGSTCSDQFPTTPTAILKSAPGSQQVDVCDGFVAWLNAEGSRMEYGTYLGGRLSDAANVVALRPDGNVVYVGGYTSSPDFPVTASAPQRQLNGSTNGFFAAIDVQSGKLVYSTYVGGMGNDRVTDIAVAADGQVYVSGTTDSKRWPQIGLTGFGHLGATDGFIVRLDPSGKLRPTGIRIGGSGDESLAALALDAQGYVYAVGTTDSANFPVTAGNFRNIGSGFVIKVDGRRFSGKKSAIKWSRRVGGSGEDALLAVSAGMPGSVFVSGRSGSTDFPATADAIYRHLEAANDSILVRLRSEDGRIEFATFVGGTRQQNVSWYNDEATGVFANENGDVLVTGCTLDDRLPGTSNALQARRKGNADAFVLRMKFASAH